MARQVLDDWFQQEYMNASQNGDELLLQAYRQHARSAECYYIQPQEAIQCWQAAQQLAALRGHTDLKLYFQNWICVAHMTLLYDYRTALDLAVRLVVEVRKYPQSPVLPSIYDNLVVVRLAVDPIGYQTEIEEMLSYLDQHPALDYSNYCSQVVNRAHLALMLDDVDTSYPLAQRYLELCLEHPSWYQRDFMGANAHEYLCGLEHLRGNWTHVRAQAQECQRRARAAGNNNEKVVLALYWLALCAYHEGNTAEGERYYQAGELQRATVGEQNRPYYFLLGELYQQRQEFQLIPPLMERVTQQMQQGGEIYGACRAWLYYACLMGRQGKDPTPQLEQARQVAAELRAPERFLAKVQRVAQGDYEG